MADGQVTLRELYAARGPHAGPHPTEDDWVRLAGAAMDEAERSAALGHAVRCSECAAIYRGLLDLEEGARAFDGTLPRRLGAPALGLGQTTRWGTWAAVAAAAAVVFAIAQPRRPAAPAPSAATGLELRGGSARPELAEPLGDALRWPGRLRWTASAGAGAYRVRILDAEGDLIWTSPLVTATEIPWPAEVAPRPGRFYWQVIALPQGGREADAAASVLGSLDYAP
ncbi:MAG: hypothetical protein ABW221_15520 [Vicinamibacteria bacterium]